MSHGVIEATEHFVRQELYDESSGHDWWHVSRVRDLAMALARAEGGDLHVIELAALLHDISDYKLNGGDDQRGPAMAEDFLRRVGEPAPVCARVAAIISTISFKGARDTTRVASLEAKIVQDADRLDAIGAIGIARAFAFGGFAKQPMHDPASSPRVHENREDYRRHKSTTINHFYEKLFLLRDRMNTATARAVAERRHAIMEAYVEEFFREWEARDVRPQDDAAE